jgi:hypothetical protein
MKVISMQMYTRRKLRPTFGGTLAEFAPTFMVFLIFLAFPLFDLLAMALIYGSGAVMAYYSAREASLVHNDINNLIDTTTMNTRILRTEGDWRSKGFGRFAKVESLTHVINAMPKDPPGQMEDAVEVIQTLTVQPFLMIPIPVTVPGLNANMTFIYANQRMIENG